MMSQVIQLDKLDLDVHILRNRTKQFEEKVAQRDDVISRCEIKISELQSIRLKQAEDLQRLKENIKKKKKEVKKK